MSGEEIIKKAIKYGEAINALENMQGGVAIIPKFGRYELREINPEAAEKIEKMIVDELNVYIIQLRSEIREMMDADEKEQLMLEEIEEEKEAEQEEKVRQQDVGVPKNDYRRGQNSQEEDDGK